MYDGRAVRPTFTNLQHDALGQLQSLSACVPSLAADTGTVSFGREMGHVDTMVLTSRGEMRYSHIRVSRGQAGDQACFAIH